MNGQAETSVSDVNMLHINPTLTRRITFCYFSQSVTDYTPIDIGYTIASIKPKFKSFAYEIQRLRHRRSYRKSHEGRENQRRRDIRRDVDAIIETKPDAVFIFIDSVIWSKVFALGRAKEIAKVIKSRDSKIYIGVCSHKIELIPGHEIVDNGTFDCVVMGDAEQAFSKLPSMLEKAAVAGVIYAEPYMQAVNSANCGSSQAGAGALGTLDHIPSPYLEHVFDDFLEAQQLKRNGRFRAFLSSARGCHFNCYYCSRSVKFEKVRHFSPTRFYHEIEYLLSKFGIWRFFVLDDAFLLSKRHLKDLISEYETRKQRNPDLANISLHVMARPETMDKQVIDFMADLRVTHLQIGLQTINPNIQYYMGRPINVEYFAEIKNWLDAKNIALQLDVILGLPGDTVEWLQKTVEYATSLSPNSIQLKQLYLNPFTLFHIHKDKYGIVTEENRDVFDADFDAPYVVRANGIDENYFIPGSIAIRSQIDEHPDIKWKYLSKRERYVSPSFYPATKRGVSYRPE